MRSESGQKETPGPLNRKRPRKGSRGQRAECASIMLPRQTRIHSIPPRQPLTYLFSSSTNGAPYDSPGHCLGYESPHHQALKGRHNGCYAPSGLDRFLTVNPRALPWAILSRPVGAQEGANDGE